MCPLHDFSSGSFEIVINGQLVFSKLKTSGFPYEEDVSDTRDLHWQPAVHRVQTMTVTVFLPPPTGTGLERDPVRPRWETCGGGYQKPHAVRHHVNLLPSPGSSASRQVHLSVCLLPSPDEPSRAHACFENACCCRGCGCATVLPPLCVLTAAPQAVNEYRSPKLKVMVG